MKVKDIIYYDINPNFTSITCYEKCPNFLGGGGSALTLPVDCTHCASVPELDTGRWRRYRTGFLLAYAPIVWEEKGETDMYKQ